MLPSYLDEHWSNPDFQSQILASFPEHARSSPEAVIKEVKELSAKDSKASYLKKLQGEIWKEGYEKGRVTTPLYEDVLPTLKKWKDQGKTIAIFSSGSVQAQKMFFGHVKDNSTGKIEDVNGLFVDNFDTLNAGPKMDMSSYVSIAKALNRHEKEVIFLSDNVKEIEAAAQAGMRAVVVDRPGNAPLSDEDREKLEVVESLEDVKFQ